MYILLFFLSTAAVTIPLGIVIGWNASRYSRLAVTERELVVPLVATMTAGLLLFALSQTWREGARFGALVGYCVVALVPGVVVFILCDWLESRRSSQARLVTAGVVGALLLSPITSLLSLLVTCAAIGACP